MTAALRTFVLLLVTVLVAACGPGPSPRTGASDLPIDATKGDGGAAVAVAPAGPREPGEDDMRIPVSGDDAVKGDRKAYVTLVLFSDFQCPFCGRLAPTIDRLVEEYGPENLRLVFKNDPLPFHQHAKLAAEVGQGVRETRGAEAFFRFHDMAFRRQQMMNPDAIRAWAVAAGADSREIDDGIERGRWRGKIERDIELAKALDANGTPASFINGVFLSGAQPYEKFKDVVEEQLKKAKALEESGVPRATIYRVAVAENFKEPKARKTIDEDEDEDTKTVWRVPVAGSPARGKASAYVTIVVFSDFQCPYCKRVEPTIDQIRKTYGDQVRIVWKDEPLPFHPRAVPAANLARAARAQKGDAGFWDVHDRLFASQPKLEDADLEQVARAAGLDVGKAMAQVKTQAYKRAIEADMDQGDDVQASGTPHFFVNGRRLVGAQPFEKFKTIIDEEVKKGEALVRSGIAATAIYDEIMKTAKGPPEPEQKFVAAKTGAPFRGAANAPVVIQEFGDFQCPFCSRVQGTIDDLLKAYPTKVKVVWRDKPLPMHPSAPMAAEAAREAFAQKGNDGFWKMHDKLFKNQQHLERADIEGYAREIGLDMTRFEKALDDHRHKADIDADDKAGTDAGISGTPAFVVGTYFVSGAQPLAKFKKVVERVLTSPTPATGAPKVAASGLVVQDLAPGSGREVKSGDTIVVHYTGTLTDGSVFDSSKKHGQPFSFTIGQGRVIKGWEQGLLGMKVGGRRKLTIPSDLAYGDRGMPPVIPPKSTLLFDVELLSIK